MKKTIWILFLFISYACNGQNGKPGWFVAGGLDFRSESIDIEDVPRGSSLPQYGPPFEKKFWKTLSVHGRVGFSPGRNWFFSTSFYTRHNVFHRVEGINFGNTTYKEPRTKKNFKYDIFLDLEKKIRLKKNKERYFFVQGGIGFVNINTRFDFVVTDTTEWGSTYAGYYKGTMLHGGPRMSLGYQHGPIKISLDGYITEDAALSTLTAVWIGTTLSYEFVLRKKP
jgi:hypothetical protein